MPYFAKLDQFNNVINVVVGNDDFLTTFEDDTPGKWLECNKQMSGGVLFDKSTKLPADNQSKASELRLNWPGVGWTYDKTLDGFIEPRPTDKDGESCASWTLNNSTGYYEPPIARPAETGSTKYAWDESVYQGDNTKGWVEE